MLIFVLYCICYGFYDKYFVVNCFFIVCVCVFFLFYVMNVIDVCDFIKVIGVFKNVKCVY